MNIFLFCRAAESHLFFLFLFPFLFFFIIYCLNYRSTHRHQLRLEHVCMGKGSIKGSCSFWKTFRTCMQLAVFVQRKYFSVFCCLFMQQPDQIKLESRDVPRYELQICFQGPKLFRHEFQLTLSMSLALSR